MTRRSLWKLALVLVAVSTLAVPVSAGNMATVELDAPLGPVEAGQPVVIGFTMLQHGVTPVTDGKPILEATHRESGAVVRADGRPDGEIGHYVAEVTFPAAGTWTWSIEPLPFPTPTSFPPLTVLAPGQLGANPDIPAVPAEGESHDAAIVGGCSGVPELFFGLADLARPDTDEPDDADAGAPAIERSESVLPVSLTALIESGGAIAIGRGATAADGLACGLVVGQPVDGELIVGLSEANDSGYVGFARLTEEDGQAVVNVYLAAGLADDPVAPAATVSIAGFSFGPASVEIPAGAAVTWTNDDTIKHEVAFDDLQLDDSGMLPAGADFTQTFTTSGIYTYLCGPHPGMVGTIIVR